MKNLNIKIITILSVLLFGFIAQQVNQENQLIIGTWYFENEASNLWEFTNDRCIWKNDGKITDVFTYSIVKEKSKNGKLDFSFLKLIHLNNGEIFEYEINSLGNDKMTLDYLGDMNTKLIYFRK